MDNLIYIKLICIDNESELFFNRVYYTIDTYHILYNKNFYIFNDKLQYIGSFTADKFITIEKFRDKRLNNILK